jgi:hypothetical protein
MLFMTDAGMDMGRDNSGVVDLAYEAKAPYAFTGKLKNVVFHLKPLVHEDQVALYEQASQVGVGQGAGA